MEKLIRYRVFDGITNLSIASNGVCIITNYNTVVIYFCCLNYVSNHCASVIKTLVHVSILNPEL